MATPIEALQGVPNASQPLPNLVTGGQPTREQFQALREAGVEVVLDIRHPLEPRGYDQQALMKELGFEYINIVVSDGTLTDDTLGAIIDALRANQDRSTLFHCNSGNRVGGAMIPYLILDHDMSEEDATMAAMRMGLRGMSMLEWGMQYARARGQEA